MTEQDRRRFQRIRRRRKLGLVMSDGSVEYLWTVDISLGGMQVHTEHMVDVGSQFPMVMGVYDTAQEAYVTVRGRVVVANKVYDGSHRSFRVGLEIMSFEGDGEEVFSRHLRDIEQQRL